MKREKRDKAIYKFMYKEDKTVMLMSLKAGGVGLVSIIVVPQAFVAH